MEAVGGDPARRPQLAATAGDPAARPAALGGLIPHDRHLQWDACLNVRDLGGLRTTDGARTKHGVVVRASMIGTLTPAGSAAIREHSVRTVVDLRWPAEVSAQASFYATGLAYRNVPVDNDRQLALLDHAARDTMAAQLAILARPESGIHDAVEAIAAAEPAVLIHCQAGRDRTGIVVALVLAAIGVVDVDIAADYSASDEALAVEYERFSREQPDTAASIADAIARRRAVMTPLLRAVRMEYRDAARYLASMGVAPASIARLREMLVG